MGKRSIEDRRALPLPFGPDLLAVIEAWPTLPEALRAGILAMVRAASGAL